MYDADTFWHLSLTGRIGLVALSTALGILMLWGTWRISRRQRIATRVLAGPGCFVVFDGLAPQVQDLWHMAVIDGLPLQWVIWAPRPLSAGEVLVLLAPDTLSVHARAALGWACILLAAIATRIGRQSPAGAHSQI